MHRQAKVVGSIPTWSIFFIKNTRKSNFYEAIQWSDKINADKASPFVTSDAEHEQFHQKYEFLFLHTLLRMYRGQ